MRTMNMIPKRRISMNKTKRLQLEYCIYLKADKVNKIFFDKEDSDMIDNLIEEASYDEFEINPLPWIVAKLHNQ